MSQSVTFPWPPRELSPNWRGHWSPKARAVKRYRRDAWLIAKVAGMRVDWDGEVHVHLLFCPPDKRRRDWDNMLASFKAGSDGLADALGINDSRFRQHLAVGEPRKGGAVVVALSGGV